MRHNSKQVHAELSDWLQGTCPYAGCGWNERGFCARDDEDFLDMILDLMRLGVREVTGNTITLESQTFDCEPALEDGSCAMCGGPLRTERECRGEYWGAPAYETVVRCPKCD